MVKVGTARSKSARRSVDTMPTASGFDDDGVVSALLLLLLLAVDAPATAGKDVQAMGCVTPNATAVCCKAFLREQSNVWILS